MYRGQIAEIPLGLEGLTGFKNQLRPTQLIRANNVTYQDGTLRKEGGASNLTDSALADNAIGLHDFFPTSAQQRTIAVLDDGSILKDSAGAGTFGDSLVTGLTVDAATVPVFVEGGAETASDNKKLFIYTGLNQLKVLDGDGSSVADVANPAADWSSSYPKGGCIHKNLHWAFGGADRHRVYYTTATDHENFSGGGSISVYPGEGDEIVGIISFRRLLIVFKRPVGVYIIDTSNVTEANWRVDRLTKSLGCASQNAFQVTDNDIVFMTPDGKIHSLNAIEEFGDVGSSDLTGAQGIDVVIRDIADLSGFNQVRSVYYPKKKELHFAFRGIGSLVNNRRLVIDWLLGAPRFRVSDRDECRSLALFKDTDGLYVPMYGNDDGHVVLMDRDTRSFNGVGFNGEFQTPHLDFNYLEPTLGTKNKYGEFLELVVDPKGNWNLNVDVYWDGELTDTVTFNMGITGASLGSFTLGTHRLAGDLTLNKKRRIVGGGKRLSLVFRNSGDGEDFSIARVYVHMKIGDERDQTD